MGRPVAQTPGELKRGFHERALYMCCAGGKRARGPASRSEAGLPALHPPRAARRRAGRRALELPLADFGERGDPGAAGRQQRDPQDGGADAARRRALCRGVQGRRPARGRVPVPAPEPRPGRARRSPTRASPSSPSPARFPAATRCSAPPPSASSAPASSSAARTRPTCAPTRTSSSRSRTWSTAATSTPASRAAASSASMSTEIAVQSISSKASSSSRGNTSSAIRWRRKPTSDRWCAPTRPTACARRSSRRREKARRRCSS